jgi:tRNA dimethylallyltransferase
MAGSRGCIVIAGPTASGKSALALAVARAFHGTVINADSMQVYRELRILTARPAPSDEATLPHRLYGVLPAAETCSAGRWRTLALAAIAEAEEAGRPPIVVGGTGLYLEALLRGLAPVPDIPAPARAAARAERDRLGAAGFHAALAELDPVMAERLHPGDSQRVLRAFEVVSATGRSLADWQAAPAGPGLERPSLVLVLDPPRRALYARCDARFRRMVAEGGIDEARALLALGIDPDLPAMKAVGVPELARHLAGDCDLETAIAAAQQATRRYAKRQLTWLRHRLTSNLVIGDDIFTQDIERILERFFPIIREFLLTKNRPAV